MSLIYLSSSSSEAEPLSMRIASQCESILGSGCFLSKNNETISTQKIRLEIEACDVLIIVIAKTISEKISKVGTQPIIGTQINLKAHNIIGKITLYAKTENGYKNLTKLSSLSYLKSEETEEPSCKIEDLIENNKDLILLSGSCRDFFGKLFLH